MFTDTAEMYIKNRIVHILYLLWSTIYLPNGAFKHQYCRILDIVLYLQSPLASTARYAMSLQRGASLEFYCVCSSYKSTSAVAFTLLVQLAIFVTSDPGFHD